MSVKEIATYLFFAICIVLAFEGMALNSGIETPIYAIIKDINNG